MQEPLPILRDDDLPITVDRCRMQPDVLVPVNNIANSSHGQLVVSCCEVVKKSVRISVSCTGTHCCKT